jgi:membrane-bound serine protease (ClpP class)
VLFVAFGAVLMTFGTAASAGSSTLVAGTDSELAQDGSSGQIRILEVSGLLDPVLYDFLIAELDAAESDGALAVLLQMDSKASVLDDERFLYLAERFRDTDLQTLGWVGPSGAVAFGGSAELLGVLDVIGVAAGSQIGDTGTPRLPPTEFDAAFGPATERLQNTAIGAREVVDLGISPDAGNRLGNPESEAALERSIESNSVLREFVRNVEGFQAPTPSVDDPAQLGQAQFRQLTLSGQLFHTAASPEVAYLFFAGGLMLLIFELYTAGVGVAGVIAAALFGLGSYGMGVLPVRPIGLVLLVLGILAFAVDIQTNIPRLYTAIGMVVFTLGTVFLYEGLTMSWITMGFGIVGAALYAYSGMPSMVRTRFSTPTIGRNWMVGSMGIAMTELAPEGMVQINDAPWRAITNRATPMVEGDRVRVVGIDRLVLEVEPEEGGAKDYRERS